MFLCQAVTGETSDTSSPFSFGHHTTTTCIVLHEITIVSSCQRRLAGWPRHISTTLSGPIRSDRKAFEKPTFALFWEWQQVNSTSASCFLPIRAKKQMLPGTRNETSFLGLFSDLVHGLNWKWNRLSLAASGLSLGLQLCCWIAMWEQQSFHGPSLICKNLNRWPATPSKPVSIVHRFSFCTIDRWSCYSIQHCYEKNVPTSVIFDQIFKFKALLEASSLEGYFCFEYGNNGMTDVHRPPTLTLRSRTVAAKPTHWPTLNPCHFTVPCFIFKTKTFSFSLKQALSNNVFGVKIGRTITLRRLFEVINFRRSKFVCTLSPCPVFGMCAAGVPASK